MNVPKLRFNEYNDSWSDRKISDFVTSLDAGVSVNSEEREPFKHEFSILKTSCVTSGLFNAKERKAVTNKDELSRLKERLLDKSIVISRMNTPLLVGANAYVEKAPPDTFLPDRLWQIKLNENLANMRWFSYWLNTDRNLVKIRDLATGTSNSMKNITKPDLLGVNVYLPTLPEQTKIANFLTTVDEKITQLTQKTDLLAKYKKGVMQQIFSQELRFKDDDGSEFPDWEEVLLKDIAERVKTRNKEDNKNVLTISAQQGLINQEEYFNKSVAAKDLTNYYLLHKGDFAYNKSYSNGYPMGAIKCLRRYEKGVVSTLYICFKFQVDYINAFFEQYFEAGLHNKEIEKVAQEGARNHGLLNIGIDDFFNISLTIPSKKEQTKIANFLTAIDDKITQTQAELEAAKLYKQGLLQQMFV